MSRCNWIRKFSVTIALIVTTAIVFQNCSPEGAFREVSFDIEETGLGRAGRLFTSDPGVAARELASATETEAADLGYECQIFAAENYVRCSRKSGIEIKPGKTYELPPTIEYAGYTLKLRHVYYGTSNSDQQAYADANCQQKVNYPMGSGVYIRSTSVTVPACKDDGTGQCPAKSGCQKLAKSYSGAKYYLNQTKKWTQTEILYDNAGLARIDDTEDAAPAGYTCEEYGDFLRCSKELPRAPDASYATDQTLKYKGQTLKLRYVYFGTSNADQQAYADKNCTQTVDYPMGSGIYPSAASGKVPSCKESGQCVTDNFCRKMTTKVGAAAYVKTKVRQWTTAVAVLDNSGGSQIVSARGVAGEVAATEEPTRTGTSSGTSTEIPADLNCQEFGSFIRCTKPLPKIPGASYNLASTMTYKGQTLRVRTIYFGTSNGDQQAYADANCTQKVNYPLGSGTYPGALNGTVPRCKNNGQCVTDTQCRALNINHNQARYYKNVGLNWTTAEVTYDNSGGSQLIAP
ncbi:MAG: hypothetical protein KF767_10260 [Bdellovibrionaceae bacterium]|nr:hypothetical protein [Pseudobdellovibrionaceae bacterium]